ncbi:MAG: amino acid ABC transporter permease [Clostridiales Family XIII bacterium]|jgi:His/Glu/Gln/Arg/opine family amino acid ABC transporter permease subunit|nr:amino acid ABC transporter permease [Clostridiales Family XIII bacterium]
MTTPHFVFIFFEILQSVPFTLAVGLFTLIASFIIGVLVALVFIYKTPVLWQLAAVYVSIIRGTPLLVQLFVNYYMLPRTFRNLLHLIGAEWSGDVNAIAVVLFSFSMYYGAYQQETVKAALSSVDHSQKELADSFGYPLRCTLIKIILPQATRYALPNLLNTFLSTLKAMSVVFTIGVLDIFARAKLLASLYGNPLMIFFAAALVYWCVCLVASKCVSALENKSAWPEAV